MPNDTYIDQDDDVDGQAKLSLRETWKNQPFAVRFYAFVFAGIAINLIGLEITQAVDVSIFFLDMIGTAIVSLLSGVSGGLLVALGSAMVGSLFIGDAYIFFGIVNAAGAICWAVLPRTGKRVWGADLFNPDAKGGYLRLSLRIFAIGGTTAIACVLASLLIFYLILGFDNPDSTAIASVINSGSATGRNTLKLISVIYQEGWSSFLGNSSAIPLTLMLLASNLPDKIICTLIAVIFAFSWSVLPDFTKQRTTIIRPLDSWANSRTLVIILIIAYMARFVLVTKNHFHIADGHAVPAIVISIAIILFTVFTSDTYFRAIDHSQENSLPCWHTPLEQYSFKRDVFEDYLKIFTVLLSLINLYAAQLTSGKAGSTATQAKAIFANVRADSTYVHLAIRNILILTALRYLLVIAMRLTGKFR